MKKVIPFLIALLVCLTASAKSNKVLYKSTVRFLGSEHDGSVTLRVVGYGRNRVDAKEQAQKDAVYIIVFDGIKNVGSKSILRPIIDGVNAHEKYQEYFDNFFADNGEYKKYVSLIDTKIRSANKTKTKIGYNYEMTVRVLKSQLKARLQSDSLIH